MSDFIEGGVIMNYLIIQFLLLILALIYLVRATIKKKINQIPLVKYFLTTLLLTCVVGFFVHINESNLKLAQLLYEHGEVVSTEFILSGLEQREIFPKYEMIFSILNFIFMMATFWLEKRSNKSSAKLVH